MVMQYFNPKKLTQFAQVFKGENRDQSGCEVGDKIRIITCNNDIIYIDEKAGKSRATIANKKGEVSITTPKSVLHQKIFQFHKPSSRGLFQTIESLGDKHD